MAVFQDYMQRNAGVLSRVSNPEIVHGQMGQVAPERPQMPALANNVPTDAASVGALAQPGSAPQTINPKEVLVNPNQPTAPQQDPENAPQISFEEMFKAMPKEKQSEAITQLEAQVGDIDDAYNKLIEQMGERPSEKITREDKGMLLMEFGLHLMAQSAAGRHGTDLGGAVGDAGINALESFRALKNQKKAEGEVYDRTMSAIVGARNEAQKGLREEARTTALTEAQIGEIQARTENLKREAEETNQSPPHWITYKDSESGYEYAVNTNDPENRVKLGKMPEGQESGERPFEFQTKFDYYMRIYGKDAEGNDLPPEQLQTISQDALDFANRTSGMSRSEAYEFARQEAMKLNDAGMIRPEDGQSRRQALEAEVDNMMRALGFGSSQQQQPQADRGERPRGGDIVRPEYQDVTDQIPAEILDSLPERVRQRNPETGQVFIKIGGKVYLVE